MSSIPKEKRTPILLVVVGTLLSMGVLWFVLISPLREKAARLAGQAEEGRGRVANGQRSLAAAPQVAAEVEVVRGRLKQAEGLMASGDLYAWAIQNLNRFKQDYAVEIPQISREMPCEAGILPSFPYKAAAFVIRGSGYYHDVGRFLAGLENTYPCFRIQNVELDAAGGVKNEDPEKLQFKLEIVTLVKPVEL